MRRTVHRRIATGLMALFALLAPGALPASASTSDPDVIVLDGATSAEGIVAGRGTTFYAGDLGTGDIFRGDIDSGKARRLIDAPAGRAAVGMKFDERRNLLFVAGGPTGKAFAYNTRTRESVGEYDLAPGFINDVTLTGDGAWFTNSAKGELYRITVDRNGKLMDRETLALKGPAKELTGDFNLNGIASANGGKVLIVAHSSDQAVYTVDPESGESARINTPPLPNVDGILVQGRTLWAVQNMSNKIARIKLSGDLTSGTLKDEITSKAFNVPTTVAKFGDTLAAVNAKFNVQPPPTQYEVVLVPAR
ncbi:hypothetical protein AB0N71_12070 [Pseudarthrobacter enclensis]|uniref:SMP-30/gluconolactonase/LRE family protein n=1 Tax=Pseudarthrobacter enclensis TaxID=993070 RepID=UPI00344238C7